MTRTNNHGRTHALGDICDSDLCSRHQSPLAHASQMPLRGCGVRQKPLHHDISSISLPFPGVSQSSRSQVSHLSEEPTALAPCRPHSAINSVRLEENSLLTVISPLNQKMFLSSDKLSVFYAQAPPVKRTYNHVL